MKSRCLNPLKDGFKDYGGRGIQVVPEWMDFEQFWRDMGPSWKAGLSIERIDVNDDYHKGNCCWATPEEQANNRRFHRRVKCPDGERRTVSQAARKYHLSRETIAARMRYGWDEAHLFKAPHPSNRIYVKHQARKI